MPAEINVIIVGGGPMGLVTACGLKLLNPNINILTYEKYAEYQRNHTLRTKSDKQAAFMQATNSTEVPELSQLLKRLEKDTNIRTNEFENIYKQLALKYKTKIEIAEINDSNLKQKVLSPNESKEAVHLIIGADGTHGIINRCLFPIDNQVKHEFDYVLQLRYEIESEEKSSSIPLTKFIQNMGRNAFIANEYVGYHSGGKTPVTMQMMISKDDFNALQTATSKNPYKPFSQSNEFECKIEHLPEKINSFVNNYLADRIKMLRPQEQIAKDSIRISVNEAPATCVKQAVTVWNDTPVLLLGDAALGLSYFKGLNAGLEAITKLMTLLAPIINDMDDSQKLMTQLRTYESWFLNEFAPKKIKEVADYSTWQIRFGMRAIELFYDVQNSSSPFSGFDSDYLLFDYFYLLGTEFEKQAVITDRMTFYPHREYDPVKFGQIEKTPISYSLKKLKKMAVDYIKPYKSDADFWREFRQPLVGLAHVVVGSAKLITAGAQWDKEFAADGALTLLRGGLEIVTTPLTYFVKPLTRSLVTQSYGPSLIEMRKGIQSLSTMGLVNIERMNYETANNSEIYNILAVCNDLHRKYEKSLNRGQKTHIELQESLHFKAVRRSFNENSTKLSAFAEPLKQYFSLFQPKPSNTADEKPICNTAKKRN